MTCFCAARLGSLMASLQGLPSLQHLVPPVSMKAVAAASLALGSGGMGAAAHLGASVSGQAALAANLSAMASLSAALQAAMGMNLSAAMAVAMRAQVQASLAGTLQSFHAAGGLLTPFAALLNRLLQELAGLMHLAALVLAVRTGLGIDLRASGAIVALQARLDAMAAASATASASLRASAQGSAVAAAMAALGLGLHAQGALSATASAQALGRMVAGLPMAGLNLGLLLPLASLMSLLEMIQRALGVDLLAANAMASLRLALAALPLAALARLRLTAHAAPRAALVVHENARLAVASKLNLRAVARANLAGVAPLAMLVKLGADARLGLPAGSCGKPCPLALLAPPAMPALSGGARLAA